MICIHHNDIDGRCAAAIVNKRFRSARDITFIEMDYKDSLDFNKIAPEEFVIIVDFSFKPEVMDKLISHVSGNIVWIDHHSTAKDYPYQYLPGRRSFEEKGQSGCELTWEFYFPMDMPYAVQIIGDYDKWALKISDSKIFHEGIKLLDTEPNLLIWDSLLSSWSLGECQPIIDNGRIASLYRDKYCENLCKSFGYEIELDGVKGFACNQYMFGSGGFGKKFQDYQFVAAYVHDGEKFTISLYSEKIDVGKLVVKVGKQFNAISYGGHRGASGMIIKKLPWLA